MVSRLLHDADLLGTQFRPAEQPGLPASGLLCSNPVSHAKPRGCRHQPGANRLFNRFGRKRLANPPLRIGTNQAKADFFQFHPSSLNADQDRSGQKVWEGGLLRRLVRRYKLA